MTKAKESEGAARGSALPVTRTVAAEARRLAMECVTGRAPRLIGYDFRDNRGRSCALGLVLRRSGGPNTNPWQRFYELRDELYPVLSKKQRGELGDLWNCVIAANNETPDFARQWAVVFPLLALADELDGEPKASARSAPK